MALSPAPRLTCRLASMRNCDHSAIAERRL
jgi:hypothetical protein